jgi:hypothetical protein
VLSLGSAGKDRIYENRKYFYLTIIRGNKVSKNSLVKLAKMTKKPLLAFINPAKSLDKAIRFNHFMLLRNMLNHVKCDDLGVVIHSYGGDGDAAAQIAFLLRSQFEHLRGYVPYFAYSAATVIALACDEIVMGDYSNIGPIDPQKFEESEKGLSSSLEIFASINELRDISIETYSKVLPTIQSLSNDRMGPMDDLKAAREFAIEFTGILAKDFPTEKLGRSKRAIQSIGDAARKILKENPIYYSDGFRECDDEKIDRIIDKLQYSYSAHGYQIMRDEAESIGLPVVNATEKEQEIIDELSFTFSHLQDDMLVLIDPANKAAYEIEDGDLIGYALKDFK